MDALNELENVTILSSKYDYLANSLHYRTTTTEGKLLLKGFLRYDCCPCPARFNIQVTGLNHVPGLEVQLYEGFLNKNDRIIVSWPGLGNIGTAIHKKLNLFPLIGSQNLDIRINRENEEAFVIEGPFNEGKFSICSTSEGEEDECKGQMIIRKGVTVENCRSEIKAGS